MDNPTAIETADESFVSEQRRLQTLRAEIDILWTVSELSKNNGVPVPEIATKLKDIASRI